MQTSHSPLQMQQLLLFRDPTQVLMQLQHLTALEVAWEPSSHSRVQQDGSRELTCLTQEVLNRSHQVPHPSPASTLPLALHRVCASLGSESRALPRDLAHTYCKQYKVLLVVLSHAVVDPGAVMVHLPNAPLADTETTQASLASPSLAGTREPTGGWEAQALKESSKGEMQT